MDKIQQIEKRSGVSLEEALDTAGTGRYTWYVIITAGIIGFASLVNIQGMAFAMPMAGCELEMSYTVRGMMNTMGFTGMLISAQIFGFLADNFGRKIIMMCSQIATMVIIVLWSLAPNTVSLGIVLFCNGIFLTGTFTSIYVCVGEFSPSHIRSKALLVMSAMMAVSNIFLPALAWIILPLDVHIPIFGLFVFTSWRLFILLMLVPLSVALLFLIKLPETPKFLYTIGKHEEALEIIRNIYAVNQKKNKEAFPILSLSLNSDDDIGSKIGSDGNQFLNYFKKMMRDFALLFSKKYVVFTLMSCTMLFCLPGAGNTLIMWFPEQTGKIMSHSLFHDSSNFTICDIMGGRKTAIEVSCNIDYDFMFAGILLGIGEVIMCLVVGQLALNVNRKILICIASFSSAMICLMTIFLTSQYLMMLGLASMIILLFTMFPLIMSIIMELFPTQLRSNAASLTSTCARLGSTIGGQLLGIMFDNHCRAGYLGIMSSLIVGGILCILIPTKQKNNN